ncbi:MAG: cytochrome b5-like heme/steroid binding domain-containing protein [Acidimicrobiales bacterium]
MNPKVRDFLIIVACSVIPIVIVMQLPTDLWAEIGDLPAHPLVVHAVVVLLPVAALWTILAIAKPAILETTFPYLVALSTVTTVLVIAAKASGTSLSAAVGLVDAHAEAGDRLVYVSIALSAVILILAGISKFWPKRTAVLGSSVVAVLVAVVALPMTYIAGHSGAEATWKDAYAEAKQPIGDGDGNWTLSEVQLRNTREECWSVVDGTVYDLTSFVQRHPAGANDIAEMCGKDASEKFLGQHQGQGEPEMWLETLKVGVLSN